MLSQRMRNKGSKGGKGNKNIQPLKQQPQQQHESRDKVNNFCCNCNHQIENLQPQHQQQTAQRPKQQQQHQQQLQRQTEKVEGRNIIYLTNRAKLEARAELLVESVPFRLPKTAGST